MDAKTIAMYLGGAAAAAVVIYLVWKYWGKREGYLRSGLESNSKYLDSYVNNASNPYRNLNWMSNQGNYRKPLEMSAVNFYPDQEKLAQGNVFKASSVSYKGMNDGVHYFPNNEKSRHDLINWGEMSEYAKRRGIKDFNTEPDPVDVWRFGQHNWNTYTKACNELGQCDFSTHDWPWLPKGTLGN